MKKLAFMMAVAVCMALLCGCYPIWLDEDPEDLDPTINASVQQTNETESPSEANPTICTTESAPCQTETTDPATIDTPDTIKDPVVLQYENMKAIWLSQNDLTSIYLEEGTQRGEADFTKRMEQVLDNVKSQGFNTVFLQVRPFADSMYPSQFYPMSAYTVGELGANLQYDPVEIIVELAHERQLSIHAWINPMRCMTEDEILLVDSSYAIRRWYDDSQLRGRYIVLVNGRWYLNPAYEEVLDLICSGAAEALSLYDFDGLHIDDYFYPTTDASFDADAYTAYQNGGGNLSLEDYRRENLNNLVSRLFEVTHTSRPGRIFGVSPAGNVDTVYHSHYADVYLWCSENGYIDYICPQVFFGLEHGSHDFVKVCNVFQDMIKTDSVDLIIGMTLHKAFSGEDQWAGSGKDEWKNHKDILFRCLKVTQDLKDCRGVSVFCYQFFFNPLTGETVAETAEERSSFVPALKEMTWG